MKISDRKKIANEVQTRLNAGEKKADIYHAMKEDYSAPSVERSLAQWAYPEDKKANRLLNVPLLIIAIVFAVVKTVQMGSVIRSLPLPQVLSSVLTVAIYLCAVSGIKNYNLLGYFLIILMSAGTLLSTSPDKSNLLPMALAVAAIILALIQKKRLFPNTSFLLKHKKDSAGNIIF